MGQKLLMDRDCVCSIPEILSYLKYSLRQVVSLMKPSATKKWRFRSSTSHSCVHRHRRVASALLLLCTSLSCSNILIVRNDDK